MDIALDFISTVSENPVVACPIILLFAACVSLWILFSSDREILLQRIRHKRNRLTSIVIVLVFFALLLIAVDSIHFHITFLWWCTVIIWLYTIIITLHDMNPMQIVTGSNKSIYHHRFLRRYAEELWSGKTDSCERVLADGKVSNSLRERINRWLCKHPILLDNDAKIQVEFLRYRLALLKNDVEGGYEILHSLDQSQFYPEEWTEVLVKKAQCLAWMGNISAARTALEMAGIDEVYLHQNNQTLMGSSEVWIILAFISELSGEFDKAYEYAVKAKAHVELSYLPDEIKAVILNDCARYEIIHDSRAEADKSMQAAWNYIKRQKSVLRERIAINLIQVMLEYGYSESLVMRAFEELNNIHDIGNISADIDFFNIQVSILRQFGRKQECYELIKLFYRDIAQKLNKSQIECIKATVFHQMMDGEYDYTWIDRDIVTNPAYYADLNIYDRTFIFRHYYEVLSQAIYRYVRLRKPYADLYEIITSYYNGTSEYLGSAIDDIDYELRRINEYCIFKHIDLMKRKLFVLSVRDKEQHIKNNLNVYIDLKRYMLNLGLKVDAIDVGVQIVLDASNQMNVPMINMINGQAISYFEFVNNAPVLFPKLEGIFMRYEDTMPVPWLVPGDPEYVEMIREYTIRAIEEIRILQNHPIKAEISIKLMKPCLAMGMLEEVQELYSYATKSGRSDDALASWARLLLQDVRKLLSDNHLNSFYR